MQSVKVLVFGADVEGGAIGGHRGPKVDSIVSEESVVLFSSGGDRIHVVVPRTGVNHAVGGNGEVAVEGTLNLREDPFFLTLGGEGVDSVTKADGQDRAFGADDGSVKQSHLGFVEVPGLVGPHRFAFGGEGNDSTVFRSQVNVSLLVESGETASFLEGLGPQLGKFSVFQFPGVQSFGIREEDRTVGTLGEAAFDRRKVLAKLDSPSCLEFERDEDEVTGGENQSLCDQGSTAYQVAAWVVVPQLAAGIVEGYEMAVGCGKGD